MQVVLWTSVGRGKRMSHAVRLAIIDLDVVNCGVVRARVHDKSAGFVNATGISSQVIILCDLFRIVINCNFLHTRHVTSEAKMSAASNYLFLGEVSDRLRGLELFYVVTVL